MDESDPKKPKATEVVMEGTVSQILSIGKDKHAKPKRDETQVVFLMFFFGQVGFPFLACEHSGVHIGVGQLRSTFRTVYLEIFLVL